MLEKYEKPCYNDDTVTDYRGGNMKAPTIYDIAKKLNISVATVSRAMSPPGTVVISEASRLKVLQAAKEMGYRPNAQARALITRKTRHIGLFTPGILERTGLHFARMLQAVENVTRTNGYHLVVYGELDPADVEGRLDGLIILAHPNEAVPIMENLDMSSVHVWPIFAEAKVPSISWDDAEGAYCACKYLADMGHKKIAALFGDIVDDVALTPKIAGFRRAIDELGVSSVELFGDKYPDQFENGYALALDLLKSSDKFTAIFARNDLLAVGAMKALRANGLSVPDEVSVIGYNDTSVATCSDPGLTSIRTPIGETGELAANRLISIIEHKEMAFDDVVLPVSLTIRESCASPKRV
jgi:LacI family transcriptional regulator